MQITDPIADMLTRIRNAGNARHASVDVPASKMKKAIAQILLDEGYIKSFEVVEGNTQGIIRIALKYVDNRQKAITGIKRVSKPGLRVYAGAPGAAEGTPRPWYCHRFHFQRRHDRQEGSRAERRR